jgi:hypothetical protein
MSYLFMYTTPNKIASIGRSERENGRLGKRRPINRIALSLFPPAPLLQGTVLFFCPYRKESTSADPLRLPRAVRVLST